MVLVRWADLHQRFNGEPYGRDLRYKEYKEFKEFYFKKSILKKKKKFPTSMDILQFRTYEYLSCVSLSRNLDNLYVN